MRQNAGRILALAGFKRVISVIKYQEFITPWPEAGLEKIISPSS
jgi:hypothetical protein